MDRREVHGGSEYRGRSPDRDKPTGRRGRRPSQKEIEQARRERIRRKAEARRRTEGAERRDSRSTRPKDQPRPSGSSSISSEKRPQSRPVAAPKSSGDGGRKRTVRERRPSPESQGRKTRPARKRMPLWGKVVIGAVLTIMIVFALSVTVLFPVQTIIVEGETRYTSEEIVEASRIAAGEDNLFRCGRDSVEIIPKILPYINHVRIQKRLPGSVVIRVAETTPLFCMKHDRQWYTLDSNKKLLEITEKKPKNLTVVTGLLIDRSALGEDTTFFELSKIRALEELCRIIEENEIRGVISINLEDSLDVRINYENRFVIKLGIPNELETKLRYVMRVIREQLKDTDKGTLDVSGGKSVNFSPNAWVETNKGS